MVFKIHFKFKYFCLNLKALTLTYLLIIASPVLAEVLTFNTITMNPQGHVAEINNKGFQFISDRLYFYHYNEIANIQPDSDVSEKPLAQQKANVARILSMLDKDKFKKNQQQEKVLHWLKTMQYDLLEKEAQRINQTKARWPSGRWQIYSFYDAFNNDASSRDVSAFKNRLKQLKQWEKAKPQSDAAKISKMSVLSSLAWAYRGSGYSNTVTDIAKDKFLFTLNEVINIGQSLKQNKTKDLMAYNYLINAANAYGADKSTLILLAKEASKIDPLFHAVYLRALEGNLPKWGGRTSQVEEFTQWIAKKSHENNAPEMLYLVHRALKPNIDDNVYMTMNFDWEAIKRSFSDFKKKYHSNQYDVHLMAKLAVLNGDKEAANFYFSKTEQRWNYLSERLWKEKIKLKRFKIWANSKENPKYENILDSMSKGFGVFSALFETAKYTQEIFFEKDIFGNTVLHNLADSNNVDYLEIVSSVGVNLDEYNDDGDTPLLVAIKSGRTNNVKILIKNGADIYKTPEKTAGVPIYIAALYGQTNIVALLLDKEPSLFTHKGYKAKLPIHIAAKRGYGDVVKLLVVRGKSVIDQQDAYLNTPLHYAVKYGHNDIVQFLVKSQANTHLKNKRGHTALSLAKDNNFDALVVYLKSQGAPDAVVIKKNNKARKLAKKTYVEANSYFNKNDYLIAKKLYLKSVTQDPSYYLAYAALGSVAFNFEKDFLASDKYYDQSIEINSNYAENYYWKGRVNYLLNKPEIYRPLFQKYVKMAPNTYNTEDLNKNWSHLLKSEGEIAVFKQLETFRIKESHYPIALLSLVFLVAGFIRLRLN